MGMQEMGMEKGKGMKHGDMGMMEDKDMDMEMDKEKDAMDMEDDSMEMPPPDPAEPPSMSDDMRGR
jgi:hypothetical protein